MPEQEAKSSDQQSSQLDDLLQKDAAVGTSAPLAAAEFDFVSVAEWPDELKPKVEQKFRRRRPIQGSWVMLGNDELWLMPELDFLGKDIEIHERRGWLGAITVTFSDSYKHHRKLRELMAIVMAAQTDDKWQVRWEDAYMLMYLALKVNYKITDKQVNKIGLLRQEHVADILVALMGGAKKNDEPADCELPLPLTAVT